MLVDGHVLHRPMLVQTYASTVQLTGVQRVRHELIFDLYRTTGTPRLRLLAAGRFADGWLASRGAITVWTSKGGTLTLNLSLPTRTQTTPMLFTARGVHRAVRVHPGERLQLRFQVPANGAWSLHFSTTKPGYLGNERSVSVVADTVHFSSAPQSGSNPEV